jgi:hypothetical protein
VIEDKFVDLYARYSGLQNKLVAECTTEGGAERSCGRSYKNADCC